MSNSKLRGQCHCGKVVYEISGPVTQFEHCHCQTCRRINGTVYGSSAVVLDSHFRVVQGHDLLRAYQATRGKDRMFCSNCGSHVFARITDPEDHDIILRVGTLDPGHGLRAEAHIHVDDKADWYQILDDLPRYARGA